MAAKERIFIMPVIEIKNEKLTVGIDTFGAELKYVNGCNGTKFMWPGEVGVWKSTAPILFPFCGFLRMIHMNSEARNIISKVTALPT